MGMSFEQKIVLAELIKPKLEELTSKLNKTYKDGSTEEIEHAQNQLSILNSIVKRFNINI